jgi:hypothetical protein
MIRARPRNSRKRPSWDQGNSVLPPRGMNASAAGAERAKPALHRSDLIVGPSSDTLHRSWANAMSGIERDCRRSWSACDDRRREDDRTNENDKPRPRRHALEPFPPRWPKETPQRTLLSRRKPGRRGAAISPRAQRIPACSICHHERIPGRTDDNWISRC